MKNLRFSISLLLLLLSSNVFLFAEANDPITFADATVKSLCVQNWDTNGDGELSMSEAAAVTDLGTVFKNNKSITSFNELQYFTGLESIGNWALSGCSGLTSITIPNGVTSIGSGAFRQCSGLTSVTIPNSVTSIGISAFYGCSGLTTIVVASGNTKYDSRNSCNAIIETASNTLIVGCKNTTIPNGVTNIGESAFSHCTSLTSITIPDGVTSIGDYAFSGCDGLTSITIPDGVTSIGESAFLGCSGLTSITIPSSVTSIGSSAFYVCYNLKEVISMIEEPFEINANCWSSVKTSQIPLLIPKGTKTKYEAMAGWNVFTNIIEMDYSDAITFEDANVKNICLANWDKNGDGELSPSEAAAVTDLGTVFYNNSSITSFNELQYFTGLKCIDVYAFYDCSGLTSITIPDGVTSIVSNAFSGCSGLTSVTIPNSVSSIGNNPFSECSGLTSIVVASGNTKYDSRNNCNAIIETASNTLIVGCKNTTIPNSVTSIGNYAFNYCYGLTSITIPNSVTSIGNYSFNSCTGLTSVTIPDGVTSIGENAFSSCYVLTSIVVASGNTKYDSRNNCNAIIETASNTLIVGCKNTTIPSNVTSIGDYAFNYCRMLTTITIPNSVTSIGDHAFWDCNGLTSITIPSSVTSIGSYAFIGCSSITSIVVASGNTKYDSRSNCNAIIETASNTLIAGCKNTTIPDGVTSIGESAFSNCSGLTSITISDGVTNIGESAFSHCTGLTSITIPSNVTSIGNHAFYGCSGLTSVTISNSVTSIGIYAFYDCSSLTSVTVENATPIGITQYVFSNRSNATLYVPAGSKAAYEAANYWKEFKEIVELSAVDENNSLTVPDVTGYCGKQVVLPIALQNEDEIAGMQFLLTLPSGVTIAKNEKNKLMLAKTERCEDHTLSCSDKGGGKYQVLLYSSDVEAFSGNEGVVLNITLDVSADMADGDYNILISDIELSTPDEQERTCTDVVATLTVKSYMPGDANGDGKINVVDITATANYILGSPGSSFIFDAADVNHDGKVNVVDIVAIANIILYGGTPSSSRPADWQWDNNDYLVLSGHGDTFGISLNNLQTYCAFQMDVRIPEGAVLSEVRLNAGRSAGHTLSYSKLSDGLYRVLVYSADNAAIDRNEGLLLSFSGTGFDLNDISLCNICFTDAQQQSAALRWIKTGTDGVSTVAGEENAGETVYNLHGQKVQKTRKGLYIINNKKTIIR